MKPVYQTQFGGSEAPASEQGNCLAACLASIFEYSLTDVPDFGLYLNDGTWYKVLQDWLRPRNLELIVITATGDHPTGIHILAVKSTTLKNPDDGHVVVVHGNTVIHDPNPHSKGVGEKEQYWVFSVLDPSKQ